MQQPSRRPGDYILDRYMSGATQEDREAARANLYQLLATLIHIERRERTEDAENRANDLRGVDLSDPPPT